MTPAKPDPWAPVKDTDSLPQGLLDACNRLIRIEKMLTELLAKG